MAWTDLSDAASGIPRTARDWHGFTSAGGKLYVHGGYGLTTLDNYGALSDFHVFDPVAMAWTDLSHAASGIVPTARYSHGFSSRDGKLYVHGGCTIEDSGGYCFGFGDDLHSYDPVAMAWTDLSDAASGVPPAARYLHGFTSAGGKLYVHGGCSLDSCPADDLHTFDPVAMAWKDLSHAASGIVPTARYCHGFSSRDGKLYVHGGCTSENNDGYCIGFGDDLHSYDPVAMAWTDLSDAASGTPPTARNRHGFTSAAGKLYVHGGYGVTTWGGYGDLSDLHVFDPVAMAWTDLSDANPGTPPTARFGHGFTSAGGKLYVHGGCSLDSCPADDLHVFDPVAVAWTDLSYAASGILPTARYSHGFSSPDGKLYVHGGCTINDDDGFCIHFGDDLHSYDPVAMAWTDLSAAIEGTPPTARYGHGFTCLILQGALWRLYVHGGKDSSAGCAHRCFMLDILPVIVISTRVGQSKTNQKEN